MKKIVIISCITATLCASAWSQTPAIAKVPLPKGPLPAKAPNFAKWSVTITEGGGESQKSSSSTDSDQTKGQTNKAQQTVMSVIKTLPIRFVGIASSKDGNSIIWCLGEYQIQQNKYSETPTLCSKSSESYIDFNNSDFPELGWISEKNYVGAQKIGERTYLFFQDQLVDTSNGVIPSLGSSQRVQQNASMTNNSIPMPGKIEAMAYLDAETRLPVSMKKGSKTYLYKFDQAPTTPLTPPANIKSIVTAEQDRLKRLSLRPPSG